MSTDANGLALKQALVESTIKLRSAERPRVAFDPGFDPPALLLCSRCGARPAIGLCGVCHEHDIGRPPGM